MCLFVTTLMTYDVFTTLYDLHRLLRILKLLALRHLRLHAIKDTFAHSPESSQRWK
jgi:hypothetical protein